MPFAQNLLAVLPEVVILTSAALILIVDLFIDDERRHITYWLTQLALLIAACVTLETMIDHIDRICQLAGTGMLPHAASL